MPASRLDGVASMSWYEVEQHIVAPVETESRSTGRFEPTRTAPPPFLASSSRSRSCGSARASPSDSRCACHIPARVARRDVAQARAGCSGRTSRPPTGRDRRRRGTPRSPALAMACPASSSSWSTRCESHSGLNSTNSLLACHDDAANRRRRPGAGNGANDRAVVLVVHLELRRSVETTREHVRPRPLQSDEVHGRGRSLPVCGCALRQRRFADATRTRVTGLSSSSSTSREPSPRFGPSARGGAHGA